MYAKNLTNFLLHLVKEGKLQMNMEDEITRSTLVTQGGEIVNPRIARVLRDCRRWRRSDRLSSAAMPRNGGSKMPPDFISNLYVFILAGFMGFEVIRRFRLCCTRR